MEYKKIISTAMAAEIFSLPDSGFTAVIPLCP